jgi:hypothetical protein
MSIRSGESERRKFGDKRKEKTRSGKIKEKNDKAEPDPELPAGGNRAQHAVKI